MCLSLGLSYLNKHKFRHNFADCVNPLCFYSIKPETTLHFFLHCHDFLNIGRKLFDKTSEKVKHFFLHCHDFLDISRKLFDKTPEKVNANFKCSSWLHYQFK